MALQLRRDQRAALAWAHNTLDQEGGVLFADAPGFGKSYQALGLAQFANLRPIIIAPKSLVPMWRSLLQEAEIEGEVWSRGRIDANGAKQSAHRSFHNTVVIVDEAHAFVNPATQRYRALARFVVGLPVILLSATPFQNRKEDALHMLALFSGEASWLVHHAPQKEEGLQRLMQRVALARERVHSRPLVYERFPVRAERGAIVRAAAALCFQEEPRAQILHGLLARRLSSYSAWFASIRRAARYLAELGEGLSDGRVLTREVFAKEFLHGQRAFPFMLTPSQSLELQPEDARHALKILRQSAQHVRQRRHRTPWRWILKQARPVVIFSQYRATVDEIYQHLRPRMRVVCWTGAGIRSNFPRTNAPLGTQLHNAALIATDIAAEGIDLRVCRTLVHADMHWNPMRTLQREGRIQRGDAGEDATIWAPAIPHNVADLWTMRARRAYKKSLIHHYAPRQQVSPNQRPARQASFESLPEILASDDGWAELHASHPHPDYLHALVRCLQEHAMHWHAHGSRAWLRACAQAHLLPAGASYWLEFSSIDAYQSSFEGGGETMGRRRCEALRHGVERTLRGQKCENTLA